MNVYFISSPQEAIAISLLSPCKTTSLFVVVSYKNTTDRAYTAVIGHILQRYNYKYINLKLYMHRNSFNLDKPFRAIAETLSNRLLIKRFSRCYLSGCLYDHNVVIYAQRYSPILDLIPRYQLPLVKTFCLDHAPADRLPRATSMPVLLVYKEMLRKSITCFMQTPASFLLKAVSGLIKAFFSLYYPSYCGSGPASGYSWTPERDFICLSYKHAQIVPSVSQATTIAESCVLLVDHPSLYRDVPNISQELSSLDLPLVYAALCRRHVSRVKRVLIKHHPNILQRISEEALNRYNHELSSQISNHLPSLEVYPLSDLFDDSVESLYPIETYISAFNVRQVLGMYSSCMYLLQSFDGLEVISDCLDVSSFRELRARESLDLDFQFRVF